MSPLPDPAGMRGMALDYYGTMFRWYPEMMADI